MVLRCSLLGHDFGEAEVEREREERGSEVVVTVQEYEECARCGERNVISENTEVTSLSAGTDADSPPADDAEPPEPPLESDSDPADGSEDAEFIDADESATATDPTADDPVDADAGEPTAAEPAVSDRADVEPDSSAADDGIDLPTDENGEPVTDDGEILEDDDEPAADSDRDRERGEWPDSDDVGPPTDETSEPADWPDDGPAGADDAAETGAAVDPDAIDDDAVLLDDEPADPVGGADGAATDARSVTAEPPTQDAAEPAAEAASESGTGIERAESVPTPVEGESGPGENVPTEFYCPRCEYVAAGDRGSLRAGDICPDCRKGYLSERERR